RYLLHCLSPLSVATSHALLLSYILFFLTDPPPPHISTLSLHDALPISLRRAPRGWPRDSHEWAWPHRRRSARSADPSTGRLAERSEEHTSELQSRRDLVCRLLLEKKKKKENTFSEINTQHAKQSVIQY